MQPPKYNISLHELLDNPNPSSGLEWNDEVVSGLRVRSLRSLASNLQVLPEVLAEWLGFPAAKLQTLQEDDRLDQQLSSAIHRIAVAFVHTHAKFHEVEEVAAWLGTPNANLHNRQPMDLLRSQTGTTFVLTAIDRLPACAPRPEKDAPDLDESQL